MAVQPGNEKLGKQRVSRSGLCSVSKRNAEESTREKKGGLNCVSWASHTVLKWPHPSFRTMR